MTVIVHAKDGGSPLTYNDVTAVSFFTQNTGRQRIVIRFTEGSKSVFIDPANIEGFTTLEKV